MNIKTLATVLKVNAINSFNVFYHTSRKTPVIGKLLPIGMYKKTKSKYIYKYLLLIFKIVIQLLIYLGIYFFIELVINNQEIISEIPVIFSNLFQYLPFILVLCIFGNIYGNNPITKYLTVNNMDYIHFFKLKVKEYTYIVWLLDMIKSSSDTFLFIIVIVASYKQPLIMSVYYIAIYLAMYVVIQAKNLFIIKNVIVRGRVYHYLSLIVFIGVCSTSYFAYIGGLKLTDYPLVGLIILTLVISIVYLMRYDYKYVYHYYFKDNTKYLKIEIDFNYENSDKAINSKGYKSLNELFYIRHKQGLNKIQNKKGKILIALIVILMGLIIFTQIEALLSLNIVYVLFMFLSIIGNIGSSYIKALFSNCDVGLISYKFYRTKNSINNNFITRYMQLLKLNSFNTLIVCLGGLITLIVLDYSIMQVLYFIGVLFIFNVVVSFYFLFIYYLFLPFDYQLLPTNGSVYYIVNILVIQLLFYLFGLKINGQMLSLLVLGVSCAFIIIGSIVINVFASKRFKVR